MYELCSWIQEIILFKNLSQQHFIGQNVVLSVCNVIGNQSYILNSKLWILLIVFLRYIFALRYKRNCSPEYTRTCNSQYYNYICCQVWLTSNVFAHTHQTPVWNDATLCQLLVLTHPMSLKAHSNHVGFLVLPLLLKTTLSAFCFSISVGHHWFAHDVCHLKVGDQQYFVGLLHYETKQSGATLWLVGTASLKQASAAGFHDYCSSKSDKRLLGFVSTHRSEYCNHYGCWYWVLSFLFTDSYLFIY